MKREFTPLRFDPVYKNYMWGGSRFRDELGRTGTPRVCAESWEISSRPEGMSFVADGPMKGTGLAELARTWNSGLAGTAAPDPSSFPLLVKLLDARERLSLQVHPDEETAAADRVEPKTECWYVLGSAPGSRVFAGLRAGTDRAGLIGAIAGKNVESVLESVPAEPGRLIFLPGGTPHAIGEGCMMLEIQQSSDTTYRLYDWDRAGPGGDRRKLNLDKALSAIRWAGSAVMPAPSAGRAGPGNRCVILVECAHFEVARLELSRPERVRNDGRTFHAFFVAAGAVSVVSAGSELTAGRGCSFLIPAGLPEYSILPAAGGAVVIRSGLPSPAASGGDS